MTDLENDTPNVLSPTGPPWSWICCCDRPADHNRIAKWILCEHLFMLTNKMSEQGCYVENVIVWAVMADILAVMVYGWYRMMKDDE